MDYRNYFRAGWACAAVLIAAVSCKDAPKPQFGSDYTDKIIDITIEASNGRRVSFPDLYEMKATFIPDAATEHFILAGKLRLRGFTPMRRYETHAPLSGVQVNLMEMRKDSCLCEVSKTYRATENIGQYVQSEAIRCIGTGLKKMP